jgi:hypothetical protein
MTVGELIEKLGSLDSQAEVYGHDSGFEYYQIEEVTVDNVGDVILK